jgi:hypothetical protein
MGHWRVTSILARLSFECKNCGLNRGLSSAFSGHVYAELGHLPSHLRVAPFSSDHLKWDNLFLSTFQLGILGVCLCVIIGPHFCRSEISKAAVGVAVEARCTSFVATRGNRRSACFFVSILVFPHCGTLYVEALGTADAPSHGCYGGRRGCFSELSWLLAFGVSCKCLRETWPPWHIG